MDYDCIKCGLIFSSVGLFLKHRLQCHKKDDCEDCLNKVFTDLDVNEYLTRNRNFILIMNQDEISCARAIVTIRDQLYKNPLDIEEDQRSSAHDLHERSGVPIASCGLKEIEHFQNILPQYQLFVISKMCAHKPFEIVYVGPEAEKHIYLYEHDGIFDAIEYMTCDLLMWILN